MIKSLKLFFTPMCPNCPAVKDFMKDVKLDGEIIDAADEEGRKMLSLFGMPFKEFATDSK